MQASCLFPRIFFDFLKDSKFIAWIGKLGKKAIFYISIFFDALRFNFSRRLDLIILDDIFPHLLSAFRVAEYNAYLENFSSSKIYSTASAFSIINESRKFQEVVEEYEDHYPQFKDKVFEFKDPVLLNAKLIYMVFINNAYFFIDLIEKYKVPFVFTLYPGGGFRLNESSVDEKLRRVCSSPCFRKVIATQKITYDYLLQKNIVDPEKIEFIYGGVFPFDILASQKHPKKYYQKNKKTFDICFVANKYMEKGIDKGYDTFIEVAKKLLLIEDINFHVVGSFSQVDIDVSELNDRIRFYGIQKTSFFPEFYSSMDIILSPNVPFVLLPGAFDGFPTGCCVEAAFYGVAILCTDILNQNISFTDREDIVLISTDARDIAEDILSLYLNPEELYRISYNGQKSFSQALSMKNQVEPRIKLFNELLK